MNVLQVHRERIDEPEPVSRNTRQNDRSAKRFECAIRRRVRIRAEGAIGGSAERDDDVDFACFRVLEPLRCPRVYGGDDGGSGRNCRIEGPGLEVKTPLYVSSEAVKEAEQRRPTAIAKLVPYQSVVSGMGQLRRGQIQEHAHSRCSSIH